MLVYQFRFYNNDIIFLLEIQDQVFTLIYPGNINVAEQVKDRQCLSAMQLGCNDDICENEFAQTFITYMSVSMNNGFVAAPTTWALKQIPASSSESAPDDIEQIFEG